MGRTGAKSWVVRVQKDRRQRDISLGSAAKVSLKLARERAALVRSQVEVEIDPVAERRKAAGIPTFRETAALVYSEQASGWKGDKESTHGKQWLTTLDPYAFPAFGDYAVSAVDMADQTGAGATRSPAYPHGDRLGSRQGRRESSLANPAIA